MNVVWSPQTLADLKHLHAYIAREDPHIAQVLVMHIVTHIGTYLPSMPNAGRIGRVPNTRELVIANTPYIIPYHVKGMTIEILRVYHTARRWPENL